MTTDLLMCMRILSEHCTARCWGKVNWCLGGDSIILTLVLFQR